MEEVAEDTLRCIRSAGWGPLPYLPTLLFFVNYFLFLNRAIRFAIPRRHRVAAAFRWCMAFTLASQAYEIWSKTVAVVTCIVYDYIDVYPGVLCSTTLTLAAVCPLIGALAMSKRRQLQFAWTNHGPRNELGPMRYYLSRPPPRVDRVLAPAPSRSRSQEYGAPAKPNLPRPPRSA